MIALSGVRNFVGLNWRGMRFGAVRILWLRACALRQLLLHLLAVD